MLLSLPVWACIYWYNLARRRVRETVGHYFQYRLTVTLIAIIFFSYTNVTNTLLSFFTCELVGGQPGLMINLQLQYMGRSLRPPSD